MPVKEFIELSGNPIVEGIDNMKFRLQETFTINDKDLIVPWKMIKVALNFITADKRPTSG